MFPQRSAAWLLIPGLWLISSLAGEGQPKRPTIPELVSRGSTGSTSTAPSGKSPSIDELLAKADVVVRGTVGEPSSYLSDDERDVYTDYPLLDPVVLFDRAAGHVGTRDISVTQLGGTILVDGQAFRQEELGLPPLVPGTEALFILARAGERYHIAGTFYGVFGIARSRGTPLVQKHDFAPEYRNVDVEHLARDLSSRIASLGR